MEDTTKAKEALMNALLAFCKKFKGNLPELVSARKTARVEYSKAFRKLKEMDLKLLKNLKDKFFDKEILDIHLQENEYENLVGILQLKKSDKQIPRDLVR